MSSTPTFDLVIAANRLPVDRTVDAAGQVSWQRSPGGLVSAMEAVMRGRDAAWVGWVGVPDIEAEPIKTDDFTLFPVPLSASEVSEYYEGFSNDTLWPIYHDVIVAPSFHRQWWHAYRKVNERFAKQISELAAPGATVWVHDYQLQLVPQMLREHRPDVRIGWFNHIPFPPVELFSQLPSRTKILQGLLGADYLGFQQASDASNFRRACRRVLQAQTEGELITVPDEQVGAGRVVRASAVPISIDVAHVQELAASERVQQRAREIRSSVGDPEVLILGVDRLDYTKGIRHRLKAYFELLRSGELTIPEVSLVQVATPSREKVTSYMELRQEVERTVGRINGEFSEIGGQAVHYLYHSYPFEEMVAFYVAADVMLVTPLRDGMNLVAKEYVASQIDDGGALVLSEFTGAWQEMHQAFVCNPHDIEGLKQAIMSAIRTPATTKQRLMHALRRRIEENDVQTWAERFLANLAAAPNRPEPSARATGLPRAPLDPSDIDAPIHVSAPADAPAR